MRALDRSTAHDARVPFGVRCFAARVTVEGLRRNLPIDQSVTGIDLQDLLLNVPSEQVSLSA